MLGVLLRTANRILRVYISFKEPSNTLKRITLFIINVYARMWFEIRQHPDIIHASIHIFNMKKYLHSLNDYEITAWVEPVIQRNGYMMHSESILLSMLSDDDLQIKQLAIQHILEARARNDSPLRKFIIPKIKLQYDR